MPNPLEQLMGISPGQQAMDTALAQSPYHDLPHAMDNFMGFAGMAKAKIPKTAVEILEDAAPVKLVRLTRPDMPKEIYGVTAPNKISGAAETQQFSSIEEAKSFFEKLKKVFGK